MAECDRRSAGSVWTEGGCKASSYRRRTRRFDGGPYELEGVPDRPAG